MPISTHVVNQMRDTFGGGIVPIQLPIGAQDSFKGIVDLVKMKALIPANAQGTQYNESEIPADLADEAAIARLAIIEAAAETDDDLLTKYLEGEELTDEEIRAGLVAGVAQAKFCPVFCGSAQKNIGTQQLLDAVTALVPSPDSKIAKGVHPGSSEPVERKITDPFSALVFKTTADPFVGRLSYVRVFSGQLKPDSTLYNVSREKSERVGNIFTMRGKQQDMVTVAHAGDIVIVAETPGNQNRRHSGREGQTRYFPAHRLSQADVHHGGRGQK